MILVQTTQQSFYILLLKILVLQHSDSVCVHVCECECVCVCVCVCVCARRMIKPIQDLQISGSIQHNISVPQNPCTGAHTLHSEDETGNRWALQISVKPAYNPRAQPLPVRLWMSLWDSYELPLSPNLEQAGFSYERHWVLSQINVPEGL